MAIIKEESKTFPLWFQDPLKNVNYGSEFQRCMNSNLPLSAQGTTLANKSFTSGSLQGVVTAANGKSYMIPTTSTKCIIYDPSDDSIDDTTITFPAGTLKFIGGCLSNDGRYIYCIPYSATYVAIIDTLNGTVDTTSITGIVGGSSKYIGSAVVGKYIYCIPYNATQVLKIDTSNNTFSLFGSVVGATKWAGGTIALNNGKIYCTPMSSTVVGIIDPATDTIDVVSITGLAGSVKWHGSSNAPNGKIYCTPYLSDIVAIIDPVNNTIDTTTITGVPSVGTFHHACMTLAPNGLLYCPPFQADYVLIIDPSNNTIDTTSITGITPTYFGITVLSDGRLLAPNEIGGNALIILDAIDDVKDDFYLSQTINKF